MTTLQNIPFAPETIKVRWQEPYITAGLNQKAIAMTPKGVVAGFSVVPGTGYTVAVTLDPVLGLSVANVLETTAGTFALTLIQTTPLYVDLTAQAGTSVYIVLDAQYAVGSASGAQLKVVDALDPDFVVLAKVNVPASPIPGGPITAAHINNGYTTRSGDAVPEAAKPRTNLLFNPDFAAGVTTGWAFTGFATASASTDTARSDTYSLKLTRVAAGAALATSAPVPVVPGQKYRIGGWMRSAGADPIVSGNGARLLISWRLPTDVEISSEAVEGYFTGGGTTFVEVKTELTAPALASHARVEVFFDNCSGTLYVDDVEFSYPRAESIVRSAVFGGSSASGDLYHTHTSAGLSYAGGPNWADGTTNPGPVTVEAQIDKILSDLGVTSGVGASKISYTPVTPVDLTGIVRVDTALNTLDDLKAGINIANTFSKHNVFNNTGTPNDTAITATGNGNGNGITATGGASGAYGLRGNGTTTFAGVYGESAGGYGVEGLGTSAFKAGVYGSHAQLSGRGVVGSASVAGVTGIGVMALNSGGGAALWAEAATGFAGRFYNEAPEYTVFAENGDAGPGLHVSGGHGYASDVARFETLGGNPAYAVILIDALESKGVQINTSGETVGAGVSIDSAGNGAGVVISTAGTGVGVSISGTGVAGGMGLDINVSDAHGINVSASGAAHSAFIGYNEGASYTVSSSNGDGGPGLLVDGGYGYGNHVVRFTDGVGGGAGNRVLAVDVGGSGACGIDVSVGAGGNGLKVIASTTPGGEGAIDVTTTTGRGVNINTSGGIGVYSDGSFGTAFYGYGDTAPTLQIDSDSASYGAIIKSYSGGYPLRAESTTNPKVIEVVGPTIALNTAAHNSINKSNLLRAWIQIDSCASPAPVNNHSFSIASVTATNVGRLTFNFTTGTMPTNGYIPNLTFYSVGVGTTLQPILVVITQSATQYVVDVYTGTGAGTKIDLTLGSLGVHACFFGVSAAF